MTVVICDERVCKFNHDGVCHAEAIHIVSYRDAWDCSQFERDWQQMQETAGKNETNPAQTR